MKGRQPGVQTIGGATRMLGLGKKGAPMKFRVKAGKEIRKMHAGMLVELKPPEVKSPSEKSPVRLKFEECLSGWSEKRPHETKWLTNELVLWASAIPEGKTLWELIEERLGKLTERRAQKNKNRRLDRSARGKPVPLEPVTPETVIEWLFQASAAEEWMNRFRGF